MLYNNLIFIHTTNIGIFLLKKNFFIKKKGVDKKYLPLLIIRCRNGGSAFILRNGRPYGRLLIQPH